MAFSKRPRTNSVDVHHGDPAQDLRKRSKIDPSVRRPVVVPDVCFNPALTAKSDKQGEDKSALVIDPSPPSTPSYPPTSHANEDDSYDPKATLSSFYIPRQSQAIFTAIPGADADGVKTDRQPLPQAMLDNNSDDQEPGGAITRAIEWKLVYRLCQSSHLFFGHRGSVSPRGPVSRGSSGMIKVRQALRQLNLQIYTTFTVLQLDLLCHLEFELGKGTPEPDSESDSVSDSESDDDAEALSAKSTSKVDQALFLLEDLCCHLEARVNPRLIAKEALNASSAYPKLTCLVGLIESLQTDSLNFIPTPGNDPEPKNFLFNIVENVETMDALIRTYDYGVKKIPKEPRAQILSDIRKMTNSLSNLNNFVLSLQTSTASLDGIGSSLRQPITNATFPLLQKFRQQIAATCHAMSSQFGSCAHRTTHKHKILMELPSWKNLADSRSTEMSRGVPVHLFCTNCPDNHWQPASMLFLQPDHVKLCATPSLCEALNDAYNDGRDLQFYVSENSRPNHAREIPIHTLYVPRRGQKYGSNLPDDGESLWTLIDQGYFAKNFSLDRLSAHDSGVPLGMDQRKTLAVKLILGLMLSMDSKHMLNTWNLELVHFLKPIDTNLPFVSMVGHQARSLSLANFDELSDNHDSNWQCRQPFALLAKALLQIGHGDRLSDLSFSTESNSSFNKAWRKLRKVVESCLRSVTRGDIDLGMLPFLRAAQHCLDFQGRYQARRRSAQSEHRMDIAWQLISEGLLANFDLTPHVGHSLTSTVAGEGREGAATQIPTSPTTSLVMRSTNANKSPELPEVTLFDCEAAVPEQTDIGKAKIFFDKLDQFHESYARFVTGRATDTEVESPRRIRIAVLDTGIDFQHPGIMEAVLAGRIKKEYCHSWVGAENDVEDEDDGLHGTNCAHILHKAAPEADIYVGKVFQRNGFRLYQADNIASAIDHAVQSWNVDIISMSFGLRPPTPRTDGDDAREQADLQHYRELVERIEDSIYAAFAQCCIIFAAASNNGKNDERAFPASYDPYVICVNASNGLGADGGINPPTGSGSNFMTLGMGLELLRRERGNGTSPKKYEVVHRSGTSFATPIAAGLAGTALDLAERVSEIRPMAKKKLKMPQEMDKMLQLMSSPQQSYGDFYRFLAPWNHWKTSWQANKTQVGMAWNRINELFGC